MWKKCLILRQRHGYCRPLVESGIAWSIAQRSCRWPWATFKFIYIISPTANLFQCNLSYNNCAAFDYAGGKSRPTPLCVRFGPSFPTVRGTAVPPHFSAHVLCGQAVAHVCWVLVSIFCSQLFLYLLLYSFTLCNSSRRLWRARYILVVSSITQCLLYCQHPPRTERAEHYTVST